MSPNEIEVTNGPSKADLLRAITNPQEHLHASFDTQYDAVEAHVDSIEELENGMSFALSGHLTSGRLRGAKFAGIYDCEARAGRLKLKGA